MVLKGDSHKCENRRVWCVFCNKLKNYALNQLLSIVYPGYPIALLRGSSLGLSVISQDNCHIP